jgi:SsrA-binding protein
MQGEMFARKINIGKWAGVDDLEQQRAGDIKLLLNKGEIEKLTGKLQVQGTTLIPLKLIEERGLVKLILGLARGKKKWDKRAKVKEREAKRDLQADLKRSRYF